MDTANKRSHSWHQPDQDAPNSCSASTPGGGVGLASNYSEAELTQTKNN